MLANQFGKFAAGLRFENLGQRDVEALKYRILDLIGVGIAAFQLGHAQRIACLLGSGNAATAWGSGRRYGVRDTSLLNSFLSHSTYLEDGSRFTGGHPSSVVIPSAWAWAESRHLSGRDLLVAIAAGYEIFLRLGRAIYPSTVDRGFKSTAVLGAVSSAAALSSLLNLDSESAKNAIAIASMLGVGLKEGLLASSSEPVQVARSCEAGLVAALLAKNGSAGADSMIENGFLRAFADGAQPQGIADDLGSVFRVSETYMKLHAGCRGNHAPLDLVQEMLDEHKLVGSDIGRIAIEVDSVTYAADFHEPVDGAQAQFSLAFSIASLVVDGNASIFQYTNEVLARPAIREFMRRVDVTSNQVLDLEYPNKRSARATITAADGRQFSGFLDNAKGEPESPLSNHAIEAKFMVLALPALGPKAVRLRNSILNLEAQADVAAMGELLS